MSYAVRRWAGVNVCPAESSCTGPGAVGDETPSISRFHGTG